MPMLTLPRLPRTGHNLRPYIFLGRVTQRDYSPDDFTHPMRHSDLFPAMLERATINLGAAQILYLDDLPQHCAFTPPSPNAYLGTLTITLPQL